MKDFLEYCFASYFDFLGLLSKTESSEWKAQIITSSFSVVVLSLRKIPLFKKEKLLYEIINLEINKSTQNFCKAINNNFIDGGLINGNCYIKVDNITFLLILLILSFNLIFMVHSMIQYNLINIKILINIVLRSSSTLSEFLLLLDNIRINQYNN